MTHGIWVAWRRKPERVARGGRTSHSKPSYRPAHAKPGLVCRCGYASFTQWSPSRSQRITIEARRRPESLSWSVLPAPLSTSTSATRNPVHQMWMHRIVSFSRERSGVVAGDHERALGRAAVVTLIERWFCRFQLQLRMRISSASPLCGCNLGNQPGYQPVAIHTHRTLAALFGLPVLCGADDS